MRDSPFVALNIGHAKTDRLELQFTLGAIMEIAWVFYEDIRENRSLPGCTLQGRFVFVMKDMPTHAMQTHAHQASAKLPAGQTAPQPATARDQVKLVQPLPGQKGN